MKQVYMPDSNILSLLGKGAWIHILSQFAGIYSQGTRDSLTVEI